MSQAHPSQVGPPQDLDRIVADACAVAGIPATLCRPLRHYANAVYLIEDEPVVARVAYGPGSMERSTRAVAIAQWLGANGLPVTEPAATGNRRPQPIKVSAECEIAVTFWRYYPQPEREPPNDLAVLALMARALHELSGSPPIPLPTFQPMRSIADAVETAVPGCGVGEVEIAWLRRRVRTLLAEYHNLEFPLGVGLIHGDMYAGNLLWVSDSAQVVLGDWDSVCVGPREIDLAPTFASVRFGLQPSSVDRFILSYGYDLRSWRGYRTLRAIRELSTLTALMRLAPTKSSAARELKHRLDTLTSGDTAAIWNRQ